MSSFCTPGVTNAFRAILVSGAIVSNAVHTYFSVSGYMSAVKTNQIFAQFCTNSTSTEICAALASTVDSTPVETLVWDLGTIVLNFAAGWAFTRLYDAGCWPNRQNARARDFQRLPMEM